MLCVHAHACVCAYARVYVCACAVYVCAHACVCMCVSICVCACMHVGACARVCACVWGGLGISPRALYMLSMCSDIELTSQPHLTFISQILLSTYYVPRTMVDTGVGKRRSNPCVKNSFQYWWSGQ